MSLEAPAQALLEIHDLHYSYPDGRIALAGVSLSVAEGERLAVLGPNGAGKTTFVLHLNGTLSPSSGAISVAGRRVEPSTLPQVRADVGLVFQNSDDQLFMPSVMEDVMFGPRNLGLGEAESQRRATEALRDVDALHLAERAPHHLSGGERRRVALATTLAMQPSIVVFDEPTSDLDPATRHEFGELLLSTPITQLVVTHDLRFARQVCERSVVIDEGQVVVDGLTSELLDDPGLLARHRLGPNV